MQFAIIRLKTKPLHKGELTLTRRTKSWVAVLLFIAVFGALLVTATFTDLQVSHILTAKALAAHTYYTNETTYGVVLEAVGSSPVYLMLAFSFQILFWQVMRKTKKHPWKEILAILLLVAGTAAYFVMFDDAVKYALQHIGPEAELFRKAAFLKGISMFFAGLMTFFATFAIRNYSEESVGKLVMFAVAVLCVAAVSNGIIAAVKEPVGRMRYRAMNCEGGATIGGFDNFTRWYVVNGQHIPKEEMKALFGTTDALKSFPSGHTCSAGTVYCLLMLLDVFAVKSKGKRAVCWIAAIAYTGMVAVSRIIVGAHFFSDVLMGGTIAFVCMIISREIFICKGANVKAMFGKE